MKIKLNASQNLQLKGCSLDERFQLLHMWRKQGEITEEAFQYLSNLWIKRESKRNSKAPGKPADEIDRNRPRTIVEIELHRFINILRSKIKLYVTYRNIEASKLEPETIKRFCSLVENNCYAYPKTVNNLLILGLRYPDSSKELNHFCTKWIAEHKMHSYEFWYQLWQDPDFVPLDAVRLMLDGNHQLKLKFSALLIKNLIPLIENQRDKEQKRLEWSENLSGIEREKHVSRKSERLEAFNELLSVVQKASAY